MTPQLYIYDREEDKHIINPYYEKELQRMERINELINELHMHMLEQPYQRMGQMIVNIFGNETDLYYMSDEDALTHFRNYGEMGSQ